MEARDFVRDLIDSGMPQQGIADRTGISQPTLSKVFRSAATDMMSRNYRKLQALHAEVCGAPEEKARRAMPCLNGGATA